MILIFLFKNAGGYLFICVFVFLNIGTPYVTVSSTFLWPFYFSLLLLLVLWNLKLLRLRRLLRLLLLNLLYNICMVPGFETEILQPQTGVLPMSTDPCKFNC